jgi:hypothetical protein
MQQLFQTLGPILAVAIPAALIARWIVRDRREMRELERQARCGPGCICGGENVRARQNAPPVIQAPQPVYQQQPQPQIIVFQQPAPQVMCQPQAQIYYLPAQQPHAAYPPTQPQRIYLRTPDTAYAPYPQTAHPQAQQPMSYYPGQGPGPTDYPQEAYYLPPSQPVGYLPPPRASAIDEARRRFEIELEEMKRRQ